VPDHVLLVVQSQVINGCPNDLSLQMHLPTSRLVVQNYAEQGAVDL
jgi:hypothetical protein